MNRILSLNHTMWDCKHHIVLIPKGRREMLQHDLPRHFGEVFRALALQKKRQMEERHLMPDMFTP